MTTTNLYKSDSLQISSWLITKGFELLKTEKNQNKTIFIFKYRSNIEKAVDDFFCGKEVSAIKFWESIRNLKARIYQG